MAIQVEEIPESNELVRESLTQWSATRRFRVYDDDSTATPSPKQLILAFGVPRFGETHPSILSIRATNFRVRPIAARRSHTYEITVEYLPFTVGDPGGDDDEVPDPETFREEGANAERLWVDFFRVEPQTSEPWGAFTHPNTLIDEDGNWTSTAAWSQSGNNPATGPDIGGWAIDSAGRPVSSPVAIVNLFTKIVVQNPITKMQNYIGLLNRRNDADFAGFAVGSLVYVSFDMVRISEELYEVQHNFVGDEFFHARQIVYHDPRTNDPQLGRAVEAFGAGGYNTAYNPHGYPVRWVQPYPKSGDFGGLGIP